jgi:hypothetical protein
MVHNAQFQMTHTIPTNKLRDLIAVLQTLDPDIEHTAEVKVITGGPSAKRTIHFGETTEAEVIKGIRESLDLTCTATTSADLIAYIGDLITEKDELEETIRRIRKALN